MGKNHILLEQSAVTLPSLVPHCPAAPEVARLCAWPIVLAQGCCWWGEITDNKLWHVFEETLWGSGFAVHMLLAALALWKTRAAPVGEPSAQAKSS